MIVVGDAGRGFCLSLRSLFPCAFAPHPPNSLLPHGEKGEFGHPEAQNERRNAGASQKTCPCKIPPSPSPTRREGGVWASRCLKREMARRGFPKNLCLCSPQPPSPTSLGVDRTFEQRCVFWCCDGQSVLTLDPYPALRDRGKSEARLPRCDTV